MSAEVNMTSITEFVLHGVIFFFTNTAKHKCMGSHINELRDETRWNEQQS